MKNKLDPNQLSLFSEPPATAAPQIDLSPPSIIFPTEEKPPTDPNAIKISALNRAIRDFYLDQNCKLALTFDEKLSKTSRMFCLPEELEPMIEKVLAKSSMRGKLIFLSKKLREEMDSITSMKYGEKKNISIPVLSLTGVDERFQLQTKETGINLEVEIFPLSSIAFNFSCKFS